MEFIDSLLVDNKYFSLWQSVWKVVYAVQIQHREWRKLITNSKRPLYFLAETIPGFIYIKFYHRANNCGNYGDGFYNSMIDDKDGHIRSPLILSTCTVLRHAPLEWEWNKGVHPKAFKSKQKADRPDRSNYFNYKNDGGKIVSGCASMGRKLLTSPGAVDTYTFLTNTWNTLPESYQQRVYKNTLATGKRQIQQAENPTPAVVISTEAARVDNANLLDYLTSEVLLEEPEVGSTDRIIPVDNNFTDNELHFGIPGFCKDYDDEGDQIDKSDAIPTARWRRQATSELERFDLGTSEVDGYEGHDGDDADADAEEEASQADDGLTQTLED
jgi:hypothetical protein